MTKPDLDSIPLFYRGYVENVKDLDVMEALQQSSKVALTIFRTIPEDMGEYRYAEGKWSIKELLNHMMDAERIFAYRALRFSRNDGTPLPGFEENDYAPNANAQARSVTTLCDEMERLRATTIDLYSTFTPEMLKRDGTANNNRLSVLNLGYVIAGHETHHRKIIVERYLKN
ncbi:DinB family protein [Chryseosolibacter indicus]|uniref:DinB family protein n=1 Tax=Chryseosolibacter indicus TaxID=2782351 RepID=A0ABS5VNT1_9BACT|nr:DinB family protein [Chryseosolibacter indicus]MBT1703105.1 DinB family protein [Chryseosolibacter indicus]